MEFHEIAYGFLKTARVSVSRNYLRERIESHPDYPSLSSLTDILDELEIEHFALHVEEKHRWRELDFPILAHMVTKTGKLDFETIKNEARIKSEEEFLNAWTGITLFLGEKRSIAHEEHEKQNNKEKFSRRLLWSVMGLLTLFIILPHMASFKWVFFINSLLAFVGLVISGIIVSYSLGISTGVSDLFCKVGESGCDAVLGSKLGKLGGDIGLGDLAVVFFGGLLIYSSLSLDFDANSNLVFLTLLSSIAFVSTFISISYQLYLGSWCKLCLFLALIIWLQTGNLVFHVLPLLDETFNTYVPTFKQISIFGISMLLASGWLIAKPLVIAKRNSLFDKIKIRKWRQNPRWFHALLPLHKKVDDAIWEKEIYYGNPNGVLQVLIVSSPFCKYCAMAHFQMNQILAQHPEDIGVRIRFTLRSTDEQTRDYDAVFQILSAYEKFVWNGKSGQTNTLMKDIISDWYETADLEQWKSKYPLDGVNETDIIALVSKSIQWSKSMGIQQTPAFFINGFEMPNPHTFRDLFLFATEYIQILKQGRLTVSKP